MARSGSLPPLPCGGGGGSSGSRRTASVGSRRPPCAPSAPGDAPPARRVPSRERRLPLPPMMNDARSAERRKDSCGSSLTSQSVERQRGELRSEERQPSAGLPRRARGSFRGSTVHELIWSSMASSMEDRCAGCSKEKVWEIFDAFEAMDVRDVGSVRRKDFVWALGSLGARLDFQKAMNRLQLSAHFHSTAEDLSLEGFLRLAFPSASTAEMATLRRWADLRKVYLLLKPRHGFSAQRMELQRLFELLLEDEVDDVCISLGDIVQSQILTQEELRQALGDRDPTPVTFEDFCQLLKPILAQKYSVTEVSLSPEWRSGVRQRLSLAREELAPAAPVEPQLLCCS
ncbi:unnamed protein product [Polarella glacialis]|uniref:Uncharacterized protein n=3 Tax=Polarella glacialis TaxID=89957 RepID=A0A813FIB1_POLGL|nr:unnamed protein product [Polarella glacialis]